MACRIRVEAGTAFPIMFCRLTRLITDPHGLLRPSVLAALAGGGLFVHAGEIGKHNGDPADVLDTPARLAPLTWCVATTIARAGPR